MIIKHEKLFSAIQSILAAAGSDDQEARIVARHLVDSNLLGHDSHGVGMIPNYIANVGSGILHPNRHARLVRESGVISVFDGEMGYGQVIAAQATANGIEKARRQGLSAVTLGNVHHIGRVGDYAIQAADQGLVSITFANVITANPRVAAFGGNDGRLGTNPVCIGIPTYAGNEQIILDFATSRVAIGKARVAHNEGKKLEGKFLIDESGEQTDDPGVLYRPPVGACLPFGEHKGYGLSLIAEILGGALSGGGTSRAGYKETGFRNGMMTIFLRPDAFICEDMFAGEIGSLVDWVKASPSSGEPVKIPGDPERAKRADREANGIPIDDVTWGEISKAGKSVGVDLDAYC